MDLDLSNVGGEDDFTASNLPQPGQYHLQVIGVDDSLTERDAILVNCAVLNGTVDDQRGRRLREAFYLSEKAKPRLSHFAFVVGLAKAGEKVSVNFKNAVGRDFVGEVITEDYEGKNGETRTSTKLSYRGLWTTGNPKVAEVPRGELFVIEGDAGSNGSGEDSNTTPEDQEFEF